MSVLEVNCVGVLSILGVMEVKCVAFCQDASRSFSVRISREAVFDSVSALTITVFMTYCAGCNMWPSCLGQHTAPPTRDNSESISHAPGQPFGSTPSLEGSGQCGTKGA